MSALKDATVATHRALKMRRPPRATVMGVGQFPAVVAVLSAVSHSE